MLYRLWKLIYILIQLCQAITYFHTSDPPLAHLDANPSDKGLCRLQAAALAPCALLAEMANQGFSGKADKLMHTSEVFRAIQDTLALIGNASEYISQARRQGIVKKLWVDRPQPAIFMKEVAREN